MKFTESILRGVGQVMFQNNIYSGLLFLAGIFYNSWVMGLAAVAGTVISTGMAQILKYQKEDIENGLYGFNGALTGIAVVCFFGVSAGAIVALFVGAVLSTLVTHYLKKFLPPFTAPFVLVSWAVIYILIDVFDFSLLNSPETLSGRIEPFSALSKSFGQVLFQDNIITGVVFLLAIFINNKLNAAYAFYAALLGSITGWLFLQSNEALNSGLMGYNAILCAIALSENKRSDFLWLTLGIVLSTFLNIGLGKTGIITLTAPFVAATWIILYLKNLKAAQVKKSSIT